MIDNIADQQKGSRKNLSSLIADVLEIRRKKKSAGTEYQNQYDDINRCRGGLLAERVSQQIVGIMLLPLAVVIIMSGESRLLAEGQ